MKYEYKVIFKDGKTDYVWAETIYQAKELTEKDGKRVDEITRTARFPKERKAE